VAILKKVIHSDKVGPRFQKMMARYLVDMHAVLKETARILRPGGEAVFVVGDCVIRGSLVRNSRAVVELAELVGLQTLSAVRRRIPARKRYLPPPGTHSSGESLRGRMRTESVITLLKA
jgi:predicted methyltransferase